MYKQIKVLHIIGAVPFIGSILAYAVAGLISSSSSDPQLLSVVRQIVQAETT